MSFALKQGLADVLPRQVVQLGSGGRLALGLKVLIRQQPFEAATAEGEGFKMVPAPDRGEGRLVRPVPQVGVLKERGVNAGIVSFRRWRAII